MDVSESDMEEEQTSSPLEPSDAPARLAARAARLASEGWTAAEVVAGSRVRPDGRVSRLSYDPTLDEKPSEQRRIMHDALVRCA